MAMPAIAAVLGSSLAANDSFQRGQSEYNRRMASELSGLQSDVQAYARSYEDQRRLQNEINSRVDTGLRSGENRMFSLQAQLNNTDREQKQMVKDFNSALENGKSFMENKLEIAQLKHQQQVKDLHATWEQGQSSLMNKMEMEQLHRQQMAQEFMEKNMRIVGDQHDLRDEVKTFRRTYKDQRNAQHEINKQLDVNIRSVEYGTSNLKHKLEMTEQNQNQIVKDVNALVENEKLKLENKFELSQQQIKHVVNDLNTTVENEKMSLEIKLAMTQQQLQHEVQDLKTLVENDKISMEMRSEITRQQQKQMEKDVTALADTVKDLKLENLKLKKSLNYGLIIYFVSLLVLVISFLVLNGGFHVGVNENVLKQTSGRYQGRY